MVVQSLARLVHGSQVIALNVTTSVGRVVAAVLETSSGSEPGAWLPAAQPPATSQVLPGLPGTPGGRDLYVAVPGAATPRSRSRRSPHRGSYQPTGGSGIDLPGGSAVAVPLPSLGGIPAAIQITSNVPVTASMSAPGGPAGAPGAFTAATGAGAGARRGRRQPGQLGRFHSQLVLSAPQAAAQVQVTELTAAGQASAAPARCRSRGPHRGRHAPRAQQAAGRHRSRSWSRRWPARARSTPGGSSAQNGVARSILPVTSALNWVPLPAVSSSVTTALP